MRNEEIPFVLSIHVEPDERVVQVTDAGWPGFLNLAEYVRSNRARLEDATGHAARFNWCVRLDPQVAVAFGSADWVLKRHGAVFDQLMSEGDAIGIHVHCWRPVRRWFRRTWLADYADQDWTEHCIRLAHESFVAHFGRGPTIISMGDHYMSHRAMRLVEELGFRADCSMYPGVAPVKRLVKSELTRGALPDYRGAPNRPFKPSIADFTRPGPQHFRVWEVPVSTGTVRHPKRRTETRENFLLGAMPERLEEIIAQNLAHPDPYLHGEARTDVRMNPDNRKRFDWAFDYLEQLGRERGLRFVTLDEFCDRLDQAGLVEAA